MTAITIIFMPKTMQVYINNNIIESGPNSVHIQGTKIYNLNLFHF